MRRSRSIDYATLELDGLRYAVLLERKLLSLFRAAGVPPPARKSAVEAEPDPAAVDVSLLAARLLERRRRAGLSQVELARRAGVRVETLNRLERGRSNPDFSTLRKLATVLRRIEEARDVTHARNRKER